ncbi:MAG: hypothetical protein ACPGOV_00235 [Magnetovibrionaceae bacterium]
MLLRSFLRVFQVLGVLACLWLVQQAGLIPGFDLESAGSAYTAEHDVNRIFHGIAKSID